MQVSAMNAAKQCLKINTHICRHLNKSHTSNYHSTCALASSSDATDGQIEPPNVANLARMANIGVSEDEIKDWGPKIEKIVEWFGELQAVNVDGVEPALRAEVDSDNFLRPDVARNYENKEALLSQVPDMDGAFVKVPKTKTSTE